jgi:Na+/H+ antiporter NhaB
MEQTVEVVKTGGGDVTEVEVDDELEEDDEEDVEDVDEDVLEEVEEVVGKLVVKDGVSTDVGGNGSLVGTGSPIKWSVV